MGNYLFKKIACREEVKVLAIGLDASGKTTLLYRLKLGEVVTTIPTVGFNVESIRHNNVCLTCWDIGLRDKARPLIKHYLVGMDGVVFVVDSNDRERLDEAMNDLLWRVVCEDTSAGVPVLVLANKQDLNGAMTPHEVHEVIEKSGFLSQHPWQVFGTSVIKGDGLCESLDWLTNAIVEAKKEQMIQNIDTPSEQFDTKQKSDSFHAKSSYASGIVASIKSYFVR